MSKVDIECYRELVLRPVESCLTDCRDSIAGFTSYNLSQALRSELTRADVETGLLEISDDICCEIDAAADRVIDHMACHHDFGSGISH